MRGLWAMWFELTRPRTVYVYGSFEEVPFQDIPPRQRAYLSFARAGIAFCGIRIQHLLKNIGQLLVRHYMRREQCSELILADFSFDFSFFDEFLDIVWYVLHEIFREGCIDEGVKPFSHSSSIFVTIDIDSRAL